MLLSLVMCPQGDRTDGTLCKNKCCFNAFNHCPFINGTICVYDLIKQTLVTEIALSVLNRYKVINWKLLFDDDVDDEDDLVLIYFASKTKKQVKCRITNQNIFYTNFKDVVEREIFFPFSEFLLQTSV